MPDTLVHQPTESRLYNFEFAALLSTGETISSVTSVTPSPASGITVGSPAISGTKVQVRVSGATAVYYKLTAIIVTSASNTLETEGILRVVDL
jgi:hypothetical protein